MPYIKKEDRLIFDEIINLMKELDVKANGDLNYILYAYCKRFIPKNYNSLKNFCGELRQSATEIERRIVGPYENNKIKENSDIL